MHISFSDGGAGYVEGDPSIGLIYWNIEDRTSRHWSCEGCNDSRVNGASLLTVLEWDSARWSSRVLKAGHRPVVQVSFSYTAASGTTPTTQTLLSYLLLPAETLSKQKLGLKNFCYFQIEIFSLFLSNEKKNSCWTEPCCVFSIKLGLVNNCYKPPTWCVYYHQPPVRR